MYIPVPDFSVLDFIIDNWVLLTIFIGVLLVSRLIVYMDRRMVMLMRLSLLLLVVLAISDYIESWTGHLPTRTVWRVLLSALGYSLRPGILLVIISMLHGRQKPVMLIPIVLNAVLCFSSLFTNWVFGITASNEFFRGPLGFVPFVTGFFYLGLIFFETSLYFQRGQRESRGIYLFLAIQTVATLSAAIIFNRHEIFNASYAACVLVYDLFLHVQMAKRDALTRLLNRQSYYADLKNLGLRIAGAVSIDMNELKTLNDTLGHHAGDTALKTISECFLRCVSPHERIYRVGGDEFFILTMQESSDIVKELADKLREELSKTNYRCSIGWAVRESGESSEALCRRADEAMYRDKSAYYTVGGHDRRRH